MLSVSIAGDKETASTMERIISHTPGALQKALTKAAHDIHRAATLRVSGPGGTGKQQRLIGPVRRSGFTTVSGETTSFKLFRGAGGYPVPVRTGNLRRLLFPVRPGKTVSNQSGTFTAGVTEAIVVASADYAAVVHYGRGSSRKFGPRPFLVDGFKDFGGMEQILAILRREVELIL